MVINTDGDRLLSRRVQNDGSELLELIGDVLAISTDVLWAVDLNHGGDMDVFGSADRLAGFAVLAPQPRDSGRVGGNLRRPRRYHRGLLWAMYLSAMAGLPGLQDVLPAQAERGEGTQAGPARARTPSPQRPVGHDP
ncbi:transposase [Streptomyces sp. NPDC056956]|uniref:transposase n=1 Tax=Streptomyces sp. NPDC056956 TaxID=3345980 RepID=UPI00362A7F97